MSWDDPISRAFRSGRFREAHELLLRKSERSDADQVMFVETSHFLGDKTQASAVARRLLTAGRLTALHASRCAGVLGDCLWYEGQVDEALEILAKTLRLAEESKDFNQVARAASHLLERTCDQRGFD